MAASGWHGLPTECLARIAGEPGEDAYYATLSGPVTRHSDWDVVSRLGEIRVPSLVVGGRYDEATPEVMETVHRGIPGSAWVIFENSGHFPHLEETEHYLEVLSGFLDRVEAGGGPTPLKST